MRAPARVIGCVALCVLAACGSSSSTSTASSTRVPQPSTRPSPAPPVCPNPEGEACLGALSPGTYATRLFDPKITYTVPAGWANLEDNGGHFLLLPPGGDLPGVNGDTSDFVGIYGEVAAPNGCEGGPDPVAGTSAAAVTLKLSRDPALSITSKHAVVVGGLAGTVMDVAMAPTWKKACPYSNGRPIAPLITSAVMTGLDHNIGAGRKTRLYLLDYKGSALAIEVVDVHGGRDLAVHSALIPSLRFDI